MVQSQQDTAHSAIVVDHEYQAYLARFVATADRPRPLTAGEFRVAWERWQREYHAAWTVQDTATLRALERLLAL